MKFAIINDMHLGTSGGDFRGVQRKLIAQSERLIKDFVHRMNEVEHPEFVINLGDSIEDVNNREVDIKAYEKAIALLSPLKMPIYFLVGNHDVRTLSQAEIAQFLGYKNMFYAFDSKNYHFVVLSFGMTGDHTREHGDIYAEVPKEQIEWLKDELLKTKKLTIVFEHYGLADDDMIGNFWFENAPDKAHISNKLKIRKILEDSGKVKAVFTAHQHWNRMFVHNNIPYFTVTSLVENFNNNGIPTEAHTIVNLTRDKIVVDVKGNDPAKYEFVFASS